MNWKTLASTYLFKDDWLTVRADKCEKPDGKIIDPYYVYEFPDWVQLWRLHWKIRLYSFVNTGRP